MKKVDYFAIIHKHIPPDSACYAVYLPHVTLVTGKALTIARRLGLSRPELQFIEEAGMLHDIGIIKVNFPEAGCAGALPYLMHGPAGREILETEGLPRHAIVCESHIGVGITKAQIIAGNLPLPQRDMLPASIEEEIISYADLFYSKDLKRLWEEKTVEQARAGVAQFGEWYDKRFDEWHKKFKGAILN